MTREELQKLRVKLNAAKAIAKDAREHRHGLDAADTTFALATSQIRICEVVDALLDEAAK